MLTDDEAKALKRDIWAGGQKQHDVAKAFGLSQGTISRVISGESYSHVEWPNGTTGAMPQERHRKMIQLRTGRTLRTRKILPEAIPEPSRPDRAAPTLARRVEQISTLDDDFVEEMEEDFIEAIADIGPSVPDSIQQQGIDESRQEILPWEDCIDRLGVGHSLVVKATRGPSSHEGALLKKAIGVAILNISYKDEHFERAVLSILSDLEEGSEYP